MHLLQHSLHKLHVQCYPNRLGNLDNLAKDKKPNCNGLWEVTFKLKIGEWTLVNFHSSHMYMFPL